MWLFKFQFQFETGLVSIESHISVSLVYIFDSQ